MPDNIVLTDEERERLGAAERAGGQDVRRAIVFGVVMAAIEMVVIWWFFF